MRANAFVPRFCDRDENELIFGPTAPIFPEHTPSKELFNVP